MSFQPESGSGPGLSRLAIPLEVSFFQFISHGLKPWAPSYGRSGRARSIDRRPQHCKTRRALSKQLCKQASRRLDFSKWEAWRFREFGSIVATLKTVLMKNSYCFAAVVSSGPGVRERFLREISICEQFPFWNTCGDGLLACAVARKAVRRSRQDSSARNGGCRRGCATQAAPEGEDRMHGSAFLTLWAGPQCDF